MNVGYARVSIKEQSLDLQIDALRQDGCIEIYQEVASGARTARPELNRLLDTCVETTSSLHPFVNLLHLCVVHRTGWGLWHETLRSAHELMKSG